MTPSLPQFTFYDFFAGVGMAEVGLADRWQCVWANDIDERKALVHAANGDHFFYHTGDVSTVTSADLPRGADMAWVSFPCQDVSLAGWRRGMSARRSGSFWEFWRLMRDLGTDRPRVFTIENVAGLLYGAGFTGLCESLAALNMQFGAVVINAHHFVPQSRPRVFVIAVDDHIDVGAFLDPAPGSSPWIPKSVWNAANELSPDLKQRWRWWNLPAPPILSTSLSDVIEVASTDVTWHSTDETNRLLSLMHYIHRQKVEDASRRDGQQVGFIYKRTREGEQRAEVRFDGIAGCLRTPYGGSSRQIVMIVEGSEIRSRLLSPREAARLMGLPDTFRLPERYNDAYRAMGDGVVVPVVSWLGEHLLTPLAEIECPATDTVVPHSNGHIERSEQRVREWALAKA